MLAALKKLFEVAFLPLLIELVGHLNLSKIVCKELTDSVSCLTTLEGVQIGSDSIDVFLFSTCHALTFSVIGADSLAENPMRGCTTVSLLKIDGIRAKHRLCQAENAQNNQVRWQFNAGGQQIGLQPFARALKGKSVTIRMNHNT